MLKFDLTFEEDQLFSNISRRPQSTPLLLNQLPTKRNSRPFTSDNNSTTINLESAFKNLVSPIPLTSKTKSASLYSASGGAFGKKTQNDFDSDFEVKIPTKMLSNEFDICTVDEKMYEFIVV